MHSSESQKLSGHHARRTPTLAKALVAFHTFQVANKTPPTYSELAELIGKDKVIARQSIERLVLRGLVETTPGRFRNRRITAKGALVVGKLQRGELIERLA